MLYSFSQEPNPNFSRLWPSRPELLSYFHKVCQKYSLNDHLRGGFECLDARWVESHWQVTFKNLKTNATLVKTCKVLIVAAGSLSIPSDCPVPGKSSFQGPCFHSARWQDVDLKGKKVVVIGNGCSACQFVPIIAEEAKHLTQYIRSPHNMADREVLWLHKPV